MDINDKLKAKFTEKELEFRVQQSYMYNNKPVVIIVPYLKSKAIKDRLDLIFGWENWETKFIPIEKGFICELTIDFNGKKITKSDGAQYTNIEAVKGGMSDAFKRAAKMFGIGRYLDNCGAMYAAASISKGGIYTEYTKTKDGKIIYWAKPKQQQNPKEEPKKDQQQPETQPPKEEPKKDQQQPSNQNTSSNTYTITDPQLKRLYAISNKHGFTEDDIKDYIKVNFNLDSKKDLVKYQYDKLIAYIENDNRGEVESINKQEKPLPPTQPIINDNDDFLPMPVDNKYFAQAARK